MPAPAPRYAVIIPHYNDADRLARCLAALAAQDLAAVDLVVADNASTADLSDLAARHPEARFITQPEKGAAAARNKGVAETTAPWVFFLDADCLPAPDWIDTAKALAEAGPEMRVIGGRVDVFDETPPPRSGAEAFETVFAFNQERYVREEGFSVTANLITSRRALELTGPMIVGLSEDKDWCLRATAAGAVLSYASELAVSHPTRADWPALARKWRRITEESFAILPEGRGRRLIWAARACLMPASILAHLPRLLRNSDLSPGEKLRGAGVLARLRLARMGWMLRQVIGKGA